MGSETNAPDETFAEQAFELRHELVRFFALRRQGPNAEDLAQEVYARLLRVDEVHTIRNPRAYVFRVAMNLLLDARRHRRARINTVPSGTSAPELIDDGHDPFCVATEKEKLAIVRRAIARLPKRCRRAVILHRYDGWTYDEIATELGVSKSMVKKYLKKAVLACRHALDQADKGHRGNR